MPKPGIPNDGGMAGDEPESDSGADIDEPVSDEEAGSRWNCPVSVGLMAAIDTAVLPIPEPNCLPAICLVVVG